MTTDQNPESLGHRRRITDAVADAQARAEDVAVAQAAFDEAKSKVYATLSDGQEELSDDQRVAIARCLYWGQPSFNPRQVAVGLGFPNEHDMRQRVGPRRTGLRCEACDGELLQHARSNSPRSLCEECEQITTAKASARRDFLHDAKQQVLATPVNGEVEVWQALVAIVLSFPPAVSDAWEADRVMGAYRLALGFVDARRSLGRSLNAPTLDWVPTLLRAAEAIAVWYPSEVDAVVERNLGATTFTALAVRVAGALEAAGARAEDAIAVGADLNVADLVRYSTPTTRELDWDDQIVDALDRFLAAYGEPDRRKRTDQVLHP